MSLILNIDTATETGGISLALEGSILTTRESSQQKDHAAWMNVEISQMLAETGYRFTDLSAVAVSAGPGSYTGLRVSMAAAKGFCYGLKIPLVTENSLKVLALAVRPKAVELRASLICPMIDARRMEVFTALYSMDLEEVMASQAMVLDPGSFSDYLAGHTLLFTGNGSKKWQTLASRNHRLFADPGSPIVALSLLSYQKFQARKFTDIISSEPVYLKEFHTHTKK